MEWNKKILEHEVTPPQNIWDRIAYDLDNDHLVFKDKLFHAQEAPPPYVWDKVVHDLDNEYFAFKENLFHAEEAPPSNVWNNIQTLLDKETTKRASVISLPQIIRISAAAAVIAILFFTTNYFLKTKEAVINTTAQKNTQIPQKIADTDESGKDNNSITNPVVQSKEKNKLIIASNTETPVKRRQENNQPVSVQSDGGFLPVPLPELIATQRSNVTDKYDLGNSFGKRVRNLKGEIKEDISLLDLPNSYFLMTGPDGQSIRVSSKFRNTIQYLNNTGNEELLDVILRESRYWKNIFREWKEKVSNSTFIPSANNFMDITELMQLLHQNRENNF